VFKRSDDRRDFSAVRVGSISGDPRHAGLRARRLEGSGGSDCWQAARLGPHADRQQEKKIQQLIQDRTPDQLKLAYALWTRQAVSELIEAVYGVRLTVRNMGKYLKRWGFTP
jgi:transposase